MELFIRLENGQPVDHPIHKANFIDAFPDIDLNNLPSNYVRFERIIQPKLGPYEKNQTLQYQLGSDGVCRDVWNCEQMTAEERLAKQNEVKADWQSSGTTFVSWVFDETLCEYVAPIPYPSDGLLYRWDEPTLAWILVEE